MTPVLFGVTTLYRVSDLNYLELYKSKFRPKSLILRYIQLNYGLQKIKVEKYSNNTMILVSLELKPLFVL